VERVGCDGKAGGWLPPVAFKHGVRLPDVFDD